MWGAFGVPDHSGLVEDLNRLRQTGLVRLRQVHLPALARAAEIQGVTDDRPPGPAGLESLVRCAVGELGGGRLAEAAEYTFGLIQGTRDWPAQDRRRKAAEVYRVGVDRFRKHYEQLVVRETAEAVLKLCRVEPASPTAAGIPQSAGGAGADFVSRQVTAAGTHGPLSLTVHVGCIELMSGIDVVVSSENTYFEIAKTYGGSVSASLRRAGARRGPAGDIRDDIIARELASWVGKHMAPGLAAAPGTVAATSPGELAAQGVRRIYHAAVVTPKVSGDGYDVDAGAVMRAVTAVFTLARQERSDFAPPLSSVCLPLLGAGRGGAAPAAVIRWMWAGLDAGLAADRSWDVHLVTPDPTLAELILRQLTGPS
jgi:hypothetical protein